MPNVPASSGLVVNSGMSAMTRSSHLAPSQGRRQCVGWRLRLRHAGPFRPGNPGHDALIASPAWTFPRGCAPSATSTSSEAREFAGRHEYDGKPQDLSPAGVRAGLARLEEARAGSGAAAGPARRGAPVRGRGAEAGHLRPARTAPQEPALPPRRAGPVLLRPGLRPAAGAGRRAGRAPRRLAPGRGRGRRVARPGQRPGGGGAARRHPRSGGRAHRGNERRSRGGDPGRGAGRARTAGRARRTRGGAGRPRPGARRAGARRPDGRGRGAAGRPGPAGGAGRRRTGPAARPAGRLVRPDRRGPRAGLRSRWPANWSGITRTGAA